MSLRLAKQIIYGCFYLIFFGGVIAGIYFLFLKPAPSCFDKVQNQGETGVDCGGPCGTVCTAGASSIELVGRVMTFSIAPHQGSLLAQIKNPNAALAARNFTYKFSWYDASGALVGSASGDSFIYASEVKYVFVPNVDLGSAPIERIDFKVDGVAWDAAPDFAGPPQLTIQGMTASVGDTGIVIRGTIVNNDTVSFPSVAVVALLGGRLGEVAGASETELENVTPNGSRSFSVLYPSLREIDSSSTELFIYAKRP